MMIDLLSSRQIGRHDPRVLKNREIIRRSAKLKLCRNVKLKQSNIGGLNTADIDGIENRYFLTGGLSGGLAIHDLLRNDGEDDTCICRVDGSSGHAHKNSVQMVQWYPLDTGMFLTSGSDKVVKIWDTNTLVPVDSYELNGIVYTHDMSSVATTHSLVAVASQSARVKLIDLKSGSATHILKGHTDVVLCAQWSRSGEYILASAGKDKRALVWDIRRAKGHLEVLTENRSDSNSAAAVTHTGNVNCLSFTHDGLHLITSGNDNVIKLWDAHTWRRLEVKYEKVFNQTVKPVSVAHTNCGNGLLYIPEEANICVYDILTGRRVDTLSGHFSNVNFCVYRGEYQELYSGAHDKQVLVWVSGVRDEVGRRCVQSVDRGKEERVEDVNVDEWSSDDDDG